MIQRQLGAIVSNIHNHPVILYCQTYTALNEVYEQLEKIITEYKIEMFHGGFSTEHQEVTLKKWLNDEIPILICTVAFGLVQFYLLHLLIPY